MAPIQPCADKDLIGFKYFKQLRELLQRLHSEALAAKAGAADAPQRPAGLPEALSIVAADGTLLEALPKMLWALWLGPHDHAVKLHFQYDVLRGVPSDVALVPAWFSCH